MKLLERKIDTYLLDWKNSAKRKPLIVKGARQIGKTESIRAFEKSSVKATIRGSVASIVNPLPGSLIENR